MALVAPGSVAPTCPAALSTTEASTLSDPCRDVKVAIASGAEKGTMRCFHELELQQDAWASSSSHPEDLEWDRCSSTPSLSFPLQVRVENRESRRCVLRLLDNTERDLRQIGRLKVERNEGVAAMAELGWRTGHPERGPSQRDAKRAIRRPGLWERRSTGGEEVVCF